MQYTELFTGALPPFVLVRGPFSYLAFSRRPAERLTLSPHLPSPVSANEMKRIVGGIVSTFTAGLEKDGNTVPMLPTYVFGYPAGHETGDFIAVDLGGTNLRVCFVTLKGEGKFEVTQTKYRLTDEQKQEDGQKLFDFCARCVKNFLRDQLAINEGDESDLVLGFTVRCPL